MGKSNNGNRDLILPKQHFLVDYVPGIKQLVIVTGGSYHGFKFMMGIGHLVVRRIRQENEPDDLEEDDLADRLLDKMTWVRPEETIALHPRVVPPL